MRPMQLLPLALAAAVGAAGCGTASRDPEQTGFQAPRRDLTLREAAPARLTVASPVELARAPSQPRAAPQVEMSRAPAHSRAVRQGRRARNPAAVSPARAPAAVEATTTVVAPAAADAPDPHALAPGQTVTVLTASTASAGDAPAAGDWTDQLPAGRGHGTTIRGGGGRGCGHGGRPMGGGGFRGLR
jgi:hypothetical protein